MRVQEGSGRTCMFTLRVEGLRVLVFGCRFLIAARYLTVLRLELFHLAP